MNGINKQDSAPFIPHLIADPSNPSTLYLTAERVYRTQDRAEKWSAISQSVKGSRRCRPLDVGRILAKNVRHSASGRHQTDDHPDGHPQSTDARLAPPMTWGSKVMRGRSAATVNS